MAIPFRVSALSFNGGDVVDTSGASVVVFVGPNNVGKTRTLQELPGFLERPLKPEDVARSGYVALSDVAIEKVLFDRELIEWITANRYTWETGMPSRTFFKSPNVQEADVESIAALWAQWGSNQVGGLTSHLVRGLWCQERLGYQFSAARQEPGQHPDQPLHMLLRDGPRLALFRQAFREAFGENIIVDVWGNSARLRLSRTQEQSDFEASTSDGTPPPGLSERLEQLMMIDGQSDGVRSFAGIVLTLLTTPYPVVLIDEPEAFLHPPQARLLGRNLVDIQTEGQLFVSTHSLDVLLGLLEEHPERTMVVRLTRHEGKTFARTLAPQQLSTLWRDSLLRFSRTLDGLFHMGVIACEGDTDSQFYRAVLESMPDNAQHQLMFTYAGGKHRIPTITNSLRALGVPVQAIVDFDALNDGARLKALVEGLGAKYTDEMEAHRRTLDAQLRTAQPVTVGGFQYASAQLLAEGNAADPIEASSRKAIIELLEPESGWRAAKKAGMAAVPSGDATVAANALLASLQAVGLHVVPSGAVESFVKEASGLGPRWVVNVVEGGLLQSAVEAQAFVRDVVDGLRSAADRPDLH
jgi:hypothetical protein